jgi:acetylxylan esterase
MNQYANVLRDYCDETDPICAASGPGPFIVANHLNYFDLYSNDAAAWVRTKLGF